MSKTPRTEAAKGFFDLDSAVSAEFASELETELNDAHKAFVVATDQLVQAQSELRRMTEQKKNLFYALELIEEAFVDGDDTYKAWLEMGRIAKNALEQHQSENK